MVREAVLCDDITAAELLSSYQRKRKIAETYSSAQDEVHKKTQNNHQSRPLHQIPPRDNKLRTRPTCSANLQSGLRSAALQQHKLRRWGRQRLRPGDEELNGEGEEDKHQRTTAVTKITASVARSRRRGRVHAPRSPNVTLRSGHRGMGGHCGGSAPHTHVDSSRLMVSLALRRRVNKSSNGGVSSRRSCSDRRRLKRRCTGYCVGNLAT